jgi:hypothetical protein
MMSLTNSIDQLLDFTPFHNHIDVLNNTIVGMQQQSVAARELRHLTTRLRMRRSSLSGTSILVLSSLASSVSFIVLLAFIPLGPSLRIHIHPHNNFS